MTPTDEQRAIVAAAQRRTSFAVQAYAGSGKTTTLHLVGEALGERKALYLAFNADVVRKARSVFPPTTTVATAHGFARRSAIARYGVRIDGGDAAARAPHPHALGAARPPRRRRRPARSARRARRRRAGGVPVRHGDRAAGRRRSRGRRARARRVGRGPRGAARQRARPRRLRQAVPAAAGRGRPPVAGLRGDPLRRVPGLHRRDARPRSGDQTGVQRIYVGDPHQAIYAFRGATNAFEHLDHLPLWPLTTSFRFGPKIAALAQLDPARRHADAADPHAARQARRGRRRARPLPRPRRRADPHADDDHRRGASSELARGRKVAVVGTLHQSRLRALGELAEGIHALRVGKPTTHPRLRASARSRRSNGSPTRTPCRTCAPRSAWSSATAPTPAASWARSRARLVPQDEAEVIVATSHAFKGREGARVRVSDDFRPFATLDPAAGSAPRTRDRRRPGAQPGLRDRDPRRRHARRDRLASGADRVAAAHAGRARRPRPHHRARSRSRRRPARRNGKAPMRTGLRNPVVPKAPPKPAGPILITTVTAAERTEKAILAAAYRLEQQHGATTSRAVQQRPPARRRHAGRDAGLEHRRLGLRARPRDEHDLGRPDRRLDRPHRRRRPQQTRAGVTQGGGAALGLARGRLTQR